LPGAAFAFPGERGGSRQSWRRFIRAVPSRDTPRGRHRSTCCATGHRI